MTERFTRRKPELYRKGVFWHAFLNTSPNSSNPRPMLTVKESIWEKLAFPDDHASLSVMVDPPTIGISPPSTPLRDGFKPVYPRANRHLGARTYRIYHVYHLYTHSYVYSINMYNTMQALGIARESNIFMVWPQPDDYGIIVDIRAIRDFYSDVPKPEPPPDLSKMSAFEAYKYFFGKELDPNINIVS